MTPNNLELRSTGRREFLQQVSAAAVTAGLVSTSTADPPAAVGITPLATIPLGTDRGSGSSCAPLALLHDAQA
jgi:hypothetical protein